MNPTDFFQLLDKYFYREIPFVVYSKPNKNEVKALIQNNDTIHYVSDFAERGFVFAPFDDKQKSILIPLNSSQEIEIDSYIPQVKSESNQTNKYSEIIKNEHIDLVQNGIDAIVSKKFEKVVLSRCEAINTLKTNPINIFKRMLSNYPSAFVYCWCHPKVGLWLGATPETLIQLKANRFKTMALAGTQVYKDSLNVQWTEKEKKEQQYVTDFIVDSLGNSVEKLNISEVQTVKAGNLLHLKSSITGILKSDLKSILSKLHPTPAVCGYPKESAKQFILEEENYNREFYTGYLGELNITEKLTRNTNRRNIENNAYSSLKTKSDLFVNLRCMQIRKGQAIIYVGGGITKDSNAEQEWQETINKSSTMKAVLD